MKKFDDELIDLPPGKVVPAGTTASTGVAANHTTTKFDNDGEVDFINDRENLKAKPALGNLLPKEQSKTVRFALVHGAKAFMKPTHFLAGVNGKGMTVQCPGTNCPECAKGGEHAARRKLVALTAVARRAQPVHRQRCVGTDADARSDPATRPGRPHDNA